MWFRVKKNIDIYIYKAYGPTLPETNSRVSFLTGRRHGGVTPPASAANRPVAPDARPGLARNDFNTETVVTKTVRYGLEKATVTLPENVHKHVSKSPWKLGRNPKLFLNSRAQGWTRPWWSKPVLVWWLFGRKACLWVCGLTLLPIQQLLLLWISRSQGPQPWLIDESTP